MKKQYLTYFIVNNREKLLKKNHKILNNTILKDIINCRVEKKQLILNKYSK